MTGKTHTIQTIDRWNSRLLQFLAFGSFVLSYAAMYTLAQEAGVKWFLVWLWPMTTEAAVVIFSLALLRARLHGYDSKPLYYLIIICTALSVFFNVAHAPDSALLTRLVFALPPIFLFLAFKTWLWQIEQDTRRAGLVSELDTLSANRETLQEEIETLAARRDNLNADIKRLSEKHKQAQLPAKVAPPNQTPTERMTNLAVANAKRFGDMETRREAVLSLTMADPDITQKAMAETLGVSTKTISRDAEALGLVKNGEGWELQNGQ